MTFLRQVGLGSWLVEVESASHAASLFRHLSKDPPPHVIDIVPGAQTVLLDCESPGPTAAEIERLLDNWSYAKAAGTTQVTEIPVRYDGPDLAGVAELAGCTVREIIAAHTSADFTVAFCGFAPGFAYITGLPPLLHVPRLAQPRTSVGAGAVGLAGGYTGVYPRPSPGGWRVIGHTRATLWDEKASPPALLTPGIRVRFTPVDA